MRQVVQTSGHDTRCGVGTGTVQQADATCIAFNHATLIVERGRSRDFKMGLFAMCSRRASGSVETLAATSAQNMGQTNEN